MVNSFYIFGCLCLCVLCATAASEKHTVSKRIVLHNDDDLVDEILNLRQQLVDQHNFTQGLASQMQALVNQVSELAVQKDGLTQQLALQQGQVDHLKQQLQHQDETKTVGSTYTRWGKTTCAGNGSTVVYSGYMAGTDYDTANMNAGNYLCLTDVPTWDYYLDEHNQGVHVTGVEYHFYPHESSLEPFLGSISDGEQAPCTVCHAPRGATVMIPGTNQCTPGWTVEYQGYIVTGHPTVADSSEYVCLDRRPEAVPGSGHDEGKNILYFVETFCDNGLTCPPYKDGRELACVVCSK